MTDNLPQNLGNKAIEEAAKIAEKFLGKLVDPSLIELGSLLGDNVKFWRFKNMVNRVLEAKTFLEGKGLNPHKILPKNLIPILEAASLEEDSTIQSMWANLLASYAAGDIVTPSYPHILKELSPTEAVVLRSLYHARKSANLTGRDLLTHGSGKEDICKALKLSDGQYNLIMDNLFRLNLVQTVGASGVLLGQHPVAVKSNEIVHITTLGEGLVEACTRFGSKTTYDNKKVGIIKGPEQDNVARFG